MAFRSHSLTILLLSLTGTAAEAQHFRMETDVFVGRQQTPVAQTLTIFHDDRVYDFLLSKPDELTILDEEANVFHLAKPTERIRTTVSMEQVRLFTEQLRLQGIAKPEFAFLLRPQFQQRYDTPTGWLSLSSSQLTYRAKGTTPTRPTAVLRYQHFADWYARLNSMRPRNLPPFSRLALNRALAERKLLPTRIERITSNGSSKLVVRSQHLISWSLSATDHKRMKEANEAIDSFQRVDYATYVK